MSLENEGHRPLHVLISEDDFDDQFILKTAFRELVPDSVLHFFYTSHQLIQHLIRTGIQDELHTLPDMIIGDMKIPFFELKDIAEIRTYKQFEKIPIYVFAESFADVTRTSALALGAKGFYHKPNSLNTLKEILRELLKDRAAESSPAGDVAQNPKPELQAEEEEEE